MTLETDKSCINSGFFLKKAEALFPDIDFIRLINRYFLFVEYLIMLDEAWAKGNMTATENEFCFYSERDMPFLTYEQAKRFNETLIQNKLKEIEEKILELRSTCFVRPTFIFASIILLFLSMLTGIAAIYVHRDAYNIVFILSISIGAEAWKMLIFNRNSLVHIDKEVILFYIILTVFRVLIFIAIALFLNFIGLNLLISALILAALSIALTYTALPI